MTIRLMTVADFDEILPLDHQVFPDEVKYTMADLKRYYGEGFSYVSIDEKTNKINGYIFAKRHNNTVYIGDFGVAPHYQRQGIGSTLLQAVHVKCQHAGIKSIGLQVRKTNLSAQALYQKFGYVDSSPDRQQGKFKAMRALVTPLSTRERSVAAIRNEIYRINTHCIFFAKYKVALIEQQLEKALATNPDEHVDLSKNTNIVQALAYHRIFGFFGHKTANALKNVAKEMDATPIAQVL